MIKKTVSALLSVLMLLGLFSSVSVFAADGEAEPVVARVFRPEMAVDVVEYQGTKCIALDISVVDITDPYGLLAFDCYIKFDGDKLEPLWQTDAELNGDGVMSNTVPQMVVAWPTYTQKYVVPNVGVFTSEIMAVEGLCKPYSTTGKGNLNISMLMLTEKHKEGFKEDGEVKLRLYFVPKDGFIGGDSYTFTIDGNYEATWDQRSSITVASTSGILTSGESYDKTKLRVFGYGASATYTVPGGAEQAKKGDVNFDGSTDNLDAAYVLRYDAGITSIGEDGIRIGDVNGDGSLDSLDAAMILKFDAGIIKSFD